jgi:lipoyl(octanoyl) transferase
MVMVRKIEYVDLGICEYKKAWEFQDQTHAAILRNRENKINPDLAGTLIFVEHPHVFTLGKSGQANNLLIRDDFLEKIHASYYRTDRGGDITYHGPGQIVGYPIFDLDLLKTGIKAYIHNIETAIIDTLAAWNIQSARLEGATGVWLEPGTPDARKICAIGVRVSKSITMHGFALNVNTDLKYFSYINPCGFIDKGVTSIQKELGIGVDIDAVKMELKKNIGRLFSLKIK